MRGVIRLLLLPFVAISLLLFGCGVPISPEAITATAVAEQEAAPAAFSGAASNDTAQTLRSTSSDVAGSSVQAVEPLSTLPSPTETPAPDADLDAEDADAVVETPEADATPEDAEPTPEDGEGDPEAAVEGTETATVAPPATATPGPTSTPLPVVTGANQSFAQEFLTLLNAQRTGRGMGALSFNATLTGGATDYAGYMGTAGFFGHNGPDGSTPSSRAAATGYSGAWNGEALSAGQPTPQFALNALLASAPHAAILLDPTSVEVGIGYAFVDGSRYHHYWVVVTGKP